MIRRSLLLVALTLAGCATAPPPAPPPGGGTASEPASPAAPAPPAPAPRADPSSALLALRRDADAAMRRGDLDDAIATLERAIRLSPRDPELWLARAELSLAAGDAAAAVQFARKGLALAGDREPLQRRAWLTIADAEAARGNAEAAAAIRERWGRFRG